MTSPHYELNPAIIDDLIELLGVGFFELMEEQITQANEYVDELEVMFEEGDAAKIAKCAHALKSSTGQVGLQGIHLLVKDLEYKAKEDAAAGRPVGNAARSAFSTLKSHYVHAVRILRDYAVMKREKLKH